MDKALILLHGIFARAQRLYGLTSNPSTTGRRGMPPTVSALSSPP